MKTLTITLALLLISLLSFAQDFIEIAPGDWVFLERDGISGGFLVSVSGNGLPLLDFPEYEVDDNGSHSEVIPGEGNYLTRYLFDLDDGLEYIITGGGDESPYF